MNCRKQFAILIIGMSTIGGPAQSSPVTQTAVCDIVNNPLQFEGKLVQVRAEAWSDTDHDHQFWMNEVAMRSGKVCQFLRARFSGQAYLGGSSGFGTFTGRIVREATPLSLEASGNKVRLVFIVEQSSDVYGLLNLNGLVPLLRLYDKQTGSFIKPEQHSVRVVIQCGPARLVPGTSKMNVDCSETNWPANYDVWSTMIFQP